MPGIILQCYTDGVHVGGGRTYLSQLKCQKGYARNLEMLLQAVLICWNICDIHTYHILRSIYVYVYIINAR